MAKKTVETYKNILDAAQKVLSSQGLGKFTIRGIAIKSQMSIGTIYLYFRNKETILKKIIDHQIESEFQRLEKHFEEMKSMEIDIALQSLVQFCMTTYQKRQFMTNAVRLATLAVNDFKVEREHLSRFGKIMHDFLKSKGLQAEDLHQRAQFSCNLIISGIVFHAAIEEKLYSESELCQFTSQNLIAFLSDTN